MVQTTESVHGLDLGGTMLPGAVFAVNLVRTGIRILASHRICGGIVSCDIGGGTHESLPIQRVFALYRRKRRNIATLMRHFSVCRAKLRSAVVRKTATRIVIGVAAVTRKAAE